MQISINNKEQSSGSDCQFLILEIYWGFKLTYYEVHLKVKFYAFYIINTLKDLRLE